MHKEAAPSSVDELLVDSSIYILTTHRVEVLASG